MSSSAGTTAAATATAAAGSSNFAALSLPLPFVYRYVRNHREAAALVTVGQLARQLTMLFRQAEEKLQQGDVLQRLDRMI